ncbi:zinc ribbon domain-containing protein [Halovenus sp. HT40]|uniref:zinc ribbon domain-containing protein n=1 Tax=Halovenus sp. HT40 TaxID=3126691 RepID=UPI00300F7369
MVGVGFLIWVGWLCLGLIGLAIGLYVLRNIVREARERNRGEGPGSPGDEPVDPTPDERAVLETDREGIPQLICSNCQTPNDPSFQYCSECAAKL